MQLAFLSLVALIVAVFTVSDWSISIVAGTLNGEASTHSKVVLRLAVLLRVVHVWLSESVLTTTYYFLFRDSCPCIIYSLYVIVQNDIESFKCNSRYICYLMKTIFTFTWKYPTSDKFGMPQKLFFLANQKICHLKC